MSNSPINLPSGRKFARKFSTETPDKFNNHLRGMQELHHLGAYPS